MFKTFLKPLIVICLLVIGVGASQSLRSYLALSEASFMIFVTISAIFSILLPSLGQLKSFSISRGEIILQEVKASEAAVKELAAATLELIEVSNEVAVTVGNFDQERFDRAKKKLKSLIDET